MAGHTATARNAAADAIATLTTHLGLMDATGTELTGGSPAYARQAVAWNTAASGIADNNGAETFNVPAGTTVAFISFHAASSGGTAHSVFPVQGATGSLPHGANFAAATDTFTSFGHGLSNGDRVLLQDTRGAGLPSGFDENTLYYVVATATDTFQLSATLGGAAITSATDAEVVAIKGVPETFAAQGTYTVPSGAVDIDCNYI